VRIITDIVLSDLSEEKQSEILQEVREYIAEEYPKEDDETEEEHEQLLNEKTGDWLNCNYTINSFEMG